MLQTQTTKNNTLVILITDLNQLISFVKKNQVKKQLPVYFESPLCKKYLTQAQHMYGLKLFLYSLSI